MNPASGFVPPLAMSSRPASFLPLTPFVFLCFSLPSPTLLGAREMYLHLHPNEKELEGEVTWELNSIPISPQQTTQNGALISQFGHVCYM